MTSKKIAIVVPELLPVPPVKGGAVEHWVHEVSERLSQHKFEISIISRPAGIEGHDGIRYVGIPWTKTERFFLWLKSKLTWRNPLRYLAKIQNVTSYGIRLAKLLHDDDLVVIHNEPNLLFFINHNPNQTLILHMHNEHLTMKMLRPFYRRALKKVSLIICVSDFIRQSAIQCFPEYADKFVVVFNATNPNIFKPYGHDAIEQTKEIINVEPNHSYLLYVGRLTEVKGVHILIAAFEALLKRHANARLIIAGSSFFEGASKTAYEQTLVNLAKPISNKIIFTGFIPHEKLKYLYSVADIVVLPSIWHDPCPLVVLEAMSSGTCIVSSSVGGIPEVLKDGLNGLLVEANNVPALTEALIHVLENQHLKQTLEQTAREHILHGYTWERLVVELETHLLVTQ
jgi:spore coat protein SA